MRYIFNILIVSVLFLTSCNKKNDNNVIFKEFQNMEWSRFEYLHGNIEVKTAPVKYDIIMEVVVTDSYPSAYDNHKNDSRLLFNLTIKNPNGSGSSSRDFNFNLKDKDGNWKSEKKDGYYVFRLPIVEERTFGETGLYSVKVENKYPKEPLYGIKSLTLKFVNSK